MVLQAQIAQQLEQGLVKHGPEVMAKLGLSRFIPAAVLTTFLTTIATPMVLDLFHKLFKVVSSIVTYPFRAFSNKVEETIKKREKPTKPVEDDTDIGDVETPAGGKLDVLDGKLDEIANKLGRLNTISKRLDALEKRVKAVEGLEAPEQQGKVKKSAHPDVVRRAIADPARRDRLFSNN
jgi:hypothetical protein